MENGLLSLQYVQNWFHPSISLTLETSAQAFEAAKKVKVTYSDVRPPILTIEDSVAQGKEFVNSRKTNVTGEPDGEQ